MQALLDVLSAALQVKTCTGEVKSQWMLQFNWMVLTTYRSQVATSQESSAVAIDSTKSLHKKSNDTNQHELMTLFLNILQVVFFFVTFLAADVKEESHQSAGSPFFFCLAPVDEVSSNQTLPACRPAP